MVTLYYTVFLVTIVLIMIFLYQNPDYMLIVGVVLYGEGEVQGVDGNSL